MTSVAIGVGVAVSVLLVVALAMFILPEKYSLLKRAKPIVDDGSTEALIKKRHKRLTRKKRDEKKSESREQTKTETQPLSSAVDIETAKEPNATHNRDIVEPDRPKLDAQQESQPVEQPLPVEQPKSVVTSVFRVFHGVEETPVSIAPSFAPQVKSPEEKLADEPLTDDNDEAESKSKHSRSELDSVDSYAEVFKVVLQGGVTMTRFSKGKSKVIKCGLADGCFEYEPAGIWNRKKKSIKLSEIRAVLKGKQSAEFKMSVASRNANEDFCFSLLTRDQGTLDFETSSRVDRDAFVEGFEVVCRDSIV